jgi:hypothetical protein
MKPDKNHQGTPPKPNRTQPRAIETTHQHPVTASRRRLTRLHTHQIDSLRYPTHPQPPQLNKVKTETNKHHLNPDPLHRSHQNVTHPKDTLNHRERTLTRSPLTVYAFVPEFVPDAQRVIPCPTPHRSIPTPRLHALVALVPVHHLTRL